MDAQTIEVIDKNVELLDAIKELVRVHEELLRKGWGSFRMTAKYVNHQLERVETDTNKVRTTVKR